MTTITKPFTGTLYRYLSLTKEDKEDLEIISEWSASNNRIAAWNYINSNAHKRDHRLLCLIKNKKLYRTTPSGFNDPYDCLVEIDNNASDEDLLAWLRQYFRNQAFDPEVWQKQGTRLSKYIENNNNSLEANDRPPVIELIQTTLQEIVNKSRIICFSKSRENLLMWAHYADKHSGYCLTFDANKLKGERNLIGLFEVDYPEDQSRPLIQLSPGEIGSHELAEKILLTKSLHWRYEEEVRLIWVNREEYFVFQAESLTGIVFGAKMPRECHTGFQFLLKTLNEKEWEHVSFSRTELDSKKYKVNLRAFNKESS